MTAQYSTQGDVAVIVREGIMNVSGCAIVFEVL